MRIGGVATILRKQNADALYVEYYTETENLVKGKQETRFWWKFLTFLSYNDLVLHSVFIYFLFSRWMNWKFAADEKLYLVVIFHFSNLQLIFRIEICTLQCNLTPNFIWKFYQLRGKKLTFVAFASVERMNIKNVDIVC